jgi:MFS family permease
MSSLGGTKALFTITSLTTVAWTATQPFLAVYLSVSRGVPYWLVGGTYLLMGGITLVSQVVGGRLVDRHGPKKVMLAGFSASTAFTLFVGYLVQVNADVVLIALVYPIASLTRGISNPAAASIISGYGRDRMMSGFSLLNVGSNLGFAVGPALGGILAGLYSYSLVFYFSAGVFVAGGVVVSFTIKRGLLPGSSERLAEGEGGGRGMAWLDWKKERNLVMLLGLAFCAFVASGYEITPLSLYAANVVRLPNEQIGFLFATNGLVVVLLQVPIVRYVKRWRSLVLPLIIGNLFVIAGFFSTIASSTFAEMEFVMVVFTLGEILLTVPSQAIVAAFSRPGYRGTYQGYYNAILNAGRTMSAFVGPLSFGLLPSDPRLPWYAIAAFTAAVTVGFALLSPRLQRDYEAIRERPAMAQP